MYLKGDLTVLRAAEARMTALITPDYEVDEDGLLFFCYRSTTIDDRTGLMRMVIPKLLQKYFLHQFHTSVKADIKGSAGLTNGFEIVFTLEVCTKMYRGT